MSLALVVGVAAGVAGIAGAAAVVAAREALARDAQRRDACKRAVAASFAPNPYSGAQFTARARLDSETVEACVAKWDAETLAAMDAHARRVVCHTVPCPRGPAYTPTTGGPTHAPTAAR